MSDNTGSFEDIEGIGKDGPDLGYAVIDLASGAETLGHEPHAVFSHHQFDVVADCLGCDWIIRVVGHRIVLRSGGGRSQIIDYSDERFRPDFDRIAALLKVLATAPTEHRAFMAQLIGSTGNPSDETAGCAMLSLFIDPTFDDSRAYGSKLRQVPFRWVGHSFNCAENG